MNEVGKSDSFVVPAKPPNKAGRPAAEVVEGRGLAEGNTVDSTRPGRSAGSGVPNGLDRVREVARRDKEARFTALLHHVSLSRLHWAFEELRPQAAAGVDGVTWASYGTDLEVNLRDLHRRVQSGAYRARPSRRVYIPKADGRQRPLGIASLEDKIVQRAVVGVLNAIYEDGLSRLLLWVPARAQPARCVGCAGGRGQGEEGELGARRGHPRLLLHARSGVVDEVSRAPDSGQEGPATHPKVAERRSDRGRELVGDA